MESDLIIIGGGVSGFSAAMYAGRLKLRTLVIAAVRGGTIILTNDIANWPGIKQTDGITLAKSIEEHALEYDGVSVEDAKAVAVERADGGFKVTTEDDKTFSSKALVFATGTELRRLDVPGEKEYAGKGVHYCALCDGYAYKDRIVGVVGGSDSAAKDAILLTQWAKKVYIIYRGQRIRPEPITLGRVEEKIREGRIGIISGTNVTEIKGEEMVASVTLDKEHDGSRELRLDGLFVDIGHVPQSDLAKGLGVELDPKGYIKADRFAATNLEGVFASGDVTDIPFKQAITGSAQGVQAAYSAYEYLRGK